MLTVTGSDTRQRLRLRVSGHGGQQSRFVRATVVGFPRSVSRVRLSPSPPVTMFFQCLGRAWRWGVERGGARFDNRYQKQDIEEGYTVWYMEKIAELRSKHTRRGYRGNWSWLTVQRNLSPLFALCGFVFLFLLDHPFRPPFYRPHPVGGASYRRVTRPYDRQYFSLNRPLAQGGCSPSDSRYDAKGSSKNMISPTLSSLKWL